MARPHPSAHVAWLSAGAGLFTLGSLVLPIVSPDVGLKGDNAWHANSLVPVSHRDVSLGRIAEDVAKGWLPAGALLVSLLVIALTAACILGKLGRWPATIAAIVGLGWQVGTYLTIAFGLDYLRTPRPGVGIAVAAVGTALLASPGIVLALGLSAPAGAKVAGEPASKGY